MFHMHSFGVHEQRSEGGPLDLDSLRCFVAVAEVLHFRAASERLALSPAAVSERVKRLEEDLGAVLFARTTRRVALTDAGRRLLPHARTLLEDAVRCGPVARGDTRPLPYTLTLGTRYELGISWLVPALRPLAEARPERTVHLYMGDSDALLDRLERGLVDAVVLSTRLTRPHLRYAVLHEEQYVFVGLPGCDFPLEAAAATAHTLVDATPDLPLFRYLLDALPEGPAWRFGSHLHLGGIGAMRAAILDGMGVGVLPRYFVRDDLSAGRLVDLAPDLPLPSDHFRLIWRAAHPRESAFADLASALADLPLR